MPYAFKTDNKSTDTEYAWGGDFEVFEHCPSVDHFLSEDLEWVFSPHAQCYRLRKEAYGTLESQLDFMYHEGFDAWKRKLSQIKEDIPKP